jgi:hypothetical protein
MQKLNNLVDPVRSKSLQIEFKRANNSLRSSNNFLSKPGGDSGNDNVIYQNQQISFNFGSLNCYKDEVRGQDHSFKNNLTNNFVNALNLP